MKIRINKVFRGRRNIPLTLISINNEAPTVFAQEMGKAGLQKHDYIISEFCEEYRGVNLLWQAMMQVKPEDIRRYCQECYKSKDFNIRNACITMFSFNEKGEVHFGKEDTWLNKGRFFFSTNIYDELYELLEKGLAVEINGQNKSVNLYSGAYHFIGIEWIKTAYTKCYNEDNDIKEGCFITTAVCDTFGKPDDCYELTAFRNFRDNWLAKQEDGASLIQKYYAIAPAIVEKINSLPNARAIYLTIWAEYLKPCLAYIEQKNYLACKQKYMQMVESLAEKY